jgi:hypothetical protein
VSEQAKVRAMHSIPLLTVTALVETGTGVLLLIWPALVMALLFGWRQPAPETLVMGRVAGAGVLSIGVASWRATRDANGPTLAAVLAGVLAYNAVGAVVLVFTGAVLSMVGALLWPAVAYHLALTAWGATCLRPQPPVARP